MREEIHYNVGDEPQRYKVYNKNVRKGYSLIELLVTFTIFSLVISIVLFFYIQSQKHIIKEQERGYLEDMAVVNLNKIREKILRADEILEVSEKKIKFRTKIGKLDSIFELNNGVVISRRRLCSVGDDFIFLLWEEPASTDASFKEILDKDMNGLLHGDEILNLEILYIKYSIKRNKNQVKLSTSIYLRK